MNKIIVQALDEKRLLKFCYGGKIRVVEPHCYGVHKDTMHPVLRAFQLRGKSNNEVIGWKLFLVDKMINLHILKEEFIPQTDYNPQDKSMITIFSNIKI